MLVAAGEDGQTSPAISAVRAAVIELAGLEPEQEHAWLWVLDFPLFEPGEGALHPGHHPFVLPHPDDASKLDSDPASVRGLAYDLVYNGSELGSGSIRIHDPALQRRVLELLGMAGS